MKTSLVITTINKPNKNIKELVNLCKKNKSKFIVIGDKKPQRTLKFHMVFYNVLNQKKLDFKFSKICPHNSYARKNIGYLISIRDKDNIETIIETDDDNYQKIIF